MARPIGRSPNQLKIGQAGSTIGEVARPIGESSNPLFDALKVWNNYLNRLSSPVLFNSVEGNVVDRKPVSPGIYDFDLCFDAGGLVGDVS